MILMLFALFAGTRTDRRGNAGLARAWPSCFCSSHGLDVFLWPGDNNRMRPSCRHHDRNHLGAIACIPAINNGWWWQLFDSGTVAGRTREEAAG